MKPLFPVMALLLALAFPAWSTVKDVAANDEHLFRVYVTDGDGPVKGAVIQFCDDTVCNIGQTDASGLAVFEVPEGKSYEIHVLRVPAGYTMNTETFKTLEVYSDVTVSLEKSK
ncbi:MAG: hypothetical protein K6E38_08440 [Fretibacterium sp.]|nr:hypothetical protein [Fretibacterium sp.]